LQSNSILQNELGGVFRGSSMATDAAPQKLNRNMLEIERANVAGK
jgi:hypothetical protein